MSHFFPPFMVMVIIPFLCENILSFELAGILSIILFAIIVIVSKLFEEMNIRSGKRWIFFVTFHFYLHCYCIFRYVACLIPLILLYIGTYHAFPTDSAPILMKLQYMSDMFPTPLSQKRVFLYHQTYIKNS